jgi:HK97 family phage major capsid protein
MGEPVWVMSRQFYESVPMKLLAAAGGNTIQTIADGLTGEPRFLGNPVVFSQVMPRAAAVSVVVAMFGNFPLGAAMGDRRQLEIAESIEYAFNTDQIALRGIERVGFNIHDVGGTGPAADAINPANAASTSVAGPIVGIIAQSS